MGDYTYILPVSNKYKNPIVKKVGSSKRSKTIRVEDYRYEGEGDLPKTPENYEEKPTKGHNIKGRCNAVYCFGGKAVSVTIRTEDSADFGKHEEYYVSKIAWRGKPKSGKFEVGTEDLSQLLFNTIFFGKFHCTDLENSISAPSKAGLIVVSGTTNCCKSQVTRALIERYVASKQKELFDEMKKIVEKKEGPRPRHIHVVTLEDPIEEYIWDFKLSESQLDEFKGLKEKQGLTEEEKVRYKVLKEKQRNGRIIWDSYFKWSRKQLIDYTPRAIGAEHDCPSVEAALNSALRQTPSVVYLGEARKNEDWKSIMRFAGTGHLIVTTTHASSVTETYQKILHAQGAQTSEEVANIANKVLAIIHLTKLSDNNKQEYIVPSMWRHTPAAVAAMVGDGLSSVLPHAQPSSKDLEPKDYSFGKGAFAKQLKDHYANKENAHKAPLENQWDEIFRTSVKHDLQ